MAVTSTLGRLLCSTRRYSTPDVISFHAIYLTRTRGKAWNPASASSPVEAHIRPVPEVGLMHGPLRAGIAVYNAGEYHAAHDAWEEVWLGTDRKGDDARLLQGLIQFTAAIYHARNRNWTGTTGLAESAFGYLEGIGDRPHGVDLRPVRGTLSVLASDPEWIERSAPPSLTHEGEALSLSDLDFEESTVAAVVFAEEDDGYDEAVVERAVEYAQRDLESGRETSPFVTLVLDFAREPGRRAIAYRRLEGHVSRRRSEEDDVSGLF
jgi:uncharacterized protein